MIMDVLVKPVTALLGFLLIFVGISSYLMSGALILSALHVLTGLMGLYAFNSSQLLSHRYLVAAGLAYAVMTVFGFFFQGEILGFLSVTKLDTYLHLVISIVCLVVGFGSGK